MAKEIYVGVDGIARKVKKAYVGVDGVARKIKKGYIGVNNVARLFYSSITQTTTSQLFFYFNNFDTGDTEITGASTTSLQDGTRPTLTFTTGSTNGFRMHTGTATGYTSLCAVVDNAAYAELSYIRTLLRRTSYDRYYHIDTATPTSTSNWSIKSIVFDFITPRTLTLNIRHSGRSSNVLKFYGSNDNSSWTTISSEIDSSSDESVTSSTAYRYYMLQTSKVDSWDIYYLYFSNIQDWIIE